MASAPPYRGEGLDNHPGRSSDSWIDLPSAFPAAAATSWNRGSSPVTAAGPSLVFTEFPFQAPRNGGPTRVYQQRLKNWRNSSLRMGAMQISMVVIVAGTRREKGKFS